MNMKNVLMNFIILLICVLIMFTAVTNKQLFNHNIEILNIWLCKVFPPVFNFYVIISLLIHFNILNKILVVFKPFKKILGFDTDQGLYLFLISFLIGNPSSSSIVTNSFNNNEITVNDYYKIINSVSFPSLLFILSLYNNYVYSFIIILSMIFSSLVCLFLPVKLNCITKSRTIVTEPNKQIANIFINGISISLVIAAIMCFSSSIIFSLNYIKLPPIFTSILELCNGIFIIKKTNLSFIIELALISFLLSFNGFSIHLQVFANNINVKYYVFLFYRFVSGLLSFLFSILIYYLIF